jgi:hypothetical protein
MAATATPLATPSAGYTPTLQTQLDSTPGTLGRLTSAIGKAGGDVGALDVVAKTSTVVVRDISIACRDEAHGRGLLDARARSVRPEMPGDEGRGGQSHRQRDHRDGVTEDFVVPSVFDRRVVPAVAAAVRAAAG